MNEGKVHGNKIPEQQSMIIILRNKRVIDKIKTETAVMKRVLSTVESYASLRLNACRLLVCYRWCTR